MDKIICITTLKCLNILKESFGQGGVKKRIF